MDEQLNLFDVLTEQRAPTRRTDPQTSRDAAATVDITKGQQVVLAEFRFGPMTDEELIFALGVRSTSCPDAMLSDSGARSRRSELVKKGLLRDTGLRAKTASGRQTIIWAMA